MTAYKGPYGAFYMIHHTPKPEKDKVISCVCQSQKCDCPEPCEHCDSGDTAESGGNVPEPGDQEPDGATAD